MRLLKRVRWKMFQSTVYGLKDLAVKQKLQTLSLKGFIKVYYRKGIKCNELLERQKRQMIAAELEISGTGKAKIHTGIGFFDHMLSIYKAFADGFKSYM